LTKREASKDAGSIGEKGKKIRSGAIKIIYHVKNDQGLMTKTPIGRRGGVPVVGSRSRQPRRKTLRNKIEGNLAAYKGAKKPSQILHCGELSLRKKRRAFLSQKRANHLFMTKGGRLHEKGGWSNQGTGVIQDW